MNLEVLDGHVPEHVMTELEDIVNTFQINTPLRMAHFLAQCAHESGGFHSKRENMNYSAQGLLKTFGKYFKDQTIAEQYARKPEKIGSRVYANRMGNGDEASGDGWKYRGAGALQLTGKNNFVAFSKYVDDDIVSNPDLVADKYSVTSAAWFFSKHGINEVADRGADDSVVKSVTKIVNGGTNGLQERINYFHKFYSLLT
jgi:putative chitinase